MTAAVSVIRLLSLIVGIICVSLLIWYVKSTYTALQKYKEYDRKLLTVNKQKVGPVQTEEEWIRKNQSQTNMFKKVFGDQIYCICLKNRQDRYEHMSQQLQQVGLTARDVRFLRPEKDPRGGPWGCWESHRQINKMGFESGAPYWLCLEDDAHFDANAVKNLELLLPFITQNKNWHVINLHHHGANAAEYDDKVFKGYGISLVGYIVNRRYMEYKGFNDGLMPPAQGQHIDVALFVNQTSPVYTPQVYYAKNDIIKPDMDIISDNQNPFVMQAGIKILGQERAYNMFKKWNDFVASVHPQLPRHVIVNVVKQEENKRLGQTLVRPL